MDCYNRIKEKLLIVLICCILAMSFIFKIPTMIATWQTAIITNGTSP